MNYTHLNLNGSYQRESDLKLRQLPIRRHSVGKPTFESYFQKKIVAAAVVQAAWEDRAASAQDKNGK